MQTSAPWWSWASLHADWCTFGKSLETPAGSLRPPTWSSNHLQALRLFPSCYVSSIPVPKVSWEPWEEVPDSKGNLCSSGWHRIVEWQIISCPHLCTMKPNSTGCVEKMIRTCQLQGRLFDPGLGLLPMCFSGSSPQVLFRFSTDVCVHGDLQWIGIPFRAQYSHERLHPGVSHWRNS